MLKSIFTVTAFSILFSFNVFAEQVSKSTTVIETVKLTTQKSNTTVMEHFVTAKGLECVRYQTTQYSRSGLSLTCKWDAYNEKLATKKADRIAELSFKINQ